MPPSPEAPIDTDHTLPAHQNKSVGPVIGTIIILIILIMGALYFLSVRLNKEGTAQNQIPYIPSGTTTITVTH